MVETLHPSPRIVLSPELVERVDTEVRAAAFDDFRREEVAIIQERNPGLYQLYGSMFESALKNYGENEARQAVTGFLFSHRVLRYGNNDSPLPLRTIEQAGTILEQTAQDVPPGEKSIEEKMFEERYAGHDYLVDRVDKFRFVSTQFGARQLFILYADAIADAPNPGDAPPDTSTSLSAAIDRAYKEVKRSDYEEFVTRELTGLVEANPSFGEHVVEAAAMYIDIFGEKEAEKFTLGVSLAHRILRYARDGQLLPFKPDDECKEIIKDALARSKADDPKQSKLETAFRERFKEKPEVTDFVYNVLTQSMTRYGVELLLLTYADEVDPQIKDYATVSSS